MVETREVNPMIHDVLIKLGVSPKLRGFRYAMKCIGSFIMSPEITKLCAVYAIVAKDAKVSAHCVEKDIRVAVLRCFDRVNTELAEDIFGYGYSKESGCPSNKEFILSVAEYIENKL